MASTFSPDYAGASVMPHNHFWSGRAGASARVVIVHGTAGPGSAADIAKYFQTTERQTGTHYVIDQKGNVVQCVREVDSAWGNGAVTSGHEKLWDGISPSNPNYWTISIEHVKPHTDNSDQLTAAQKEASFKLIADICQRHNIPAKIATNMKEGGISGHYSVDPVNRARCPGPYPWNELLAYVRGDAPGFPKGVPAGWQDNGTELWKPGHNAKVVKGFREWVLNYGWNPENYPLDDEFVANPPDPTNPIPADGARQHFRDCVLIWQPGVKSYRVEMLSYLKGVEGLVPAKKKA